MTVPAIGLYSGIVPNPNTQSAEDFSTNAVDWTNYQANTLGVDINASIEQFNIDFVTVNDNVSLSAQSAIDASDFADDASGFADDSAVSATTSQSNANFKGRWSDATGAATVPRSYSNNGQTWQLLQDVPDITLDEPFDGAANWQVINDINTADVQYDLINNPVSHFFAKNKIVERMAVGTTLKSTRPSGATLTDMYGTVTTVLDDVPREQDNGWLAEISSTNKVLLSEDFSNAAWQKFNCTIDSDVGVAPDGTNTVDRVILTSNNATLRQVIVAATGSSASFYIRVATGSVTNVVVSHAQGIGISVFSQMVFPNLVRVEAKGLQKGVGGEFLDITMVGATGATLLIWRGQFEELPFVSSSIKTLGSPVTRAADGITVDTLGNVPDLTKDWSFHFEVDLISLADIGAARRLFNVVDNRFFCQLVSGVMSIGNANTSAISFPVSQTKNVVTIVQEGATTKAYVNGVLMATDSVIWELLNTDNFYMGQSATNTSHANCAFKNVQWFDGALNIDSVKTMAVR